MSPDRSRDRPSLPAPAPGADQGEDHGETAERSGRAQDLAELCERVVSHGPVTFTFRGQRLVLSREADVTAADRDGGPEAPGHPRPRDVVGDADTRVEPRLVPVLTPRQLEVAALAGAGRTLPQIAADLGIAVQTARIHLAAVRQAYRTPDLASGLVQVARDFPRPS